MGGGFSEPREVRANVQATEAFKIEWKNEEIIINTLVIIRPEDGPVKAGSRVTAFGGEYRVVKSFAIPDEFRPSHYELAVMSWGFEEDGS